MNFDPVELARTIKERRQRDGLSMRKLAKHLDLAVSTLSRIESGKGMEIRTYLAIQRWLGTSIVACSRCEGRGYVEGGP